MLVFVSLGFVPFFVVKGSACFPFFGLSVVFMFMHPLQYAGYQYVILFSEIILFLLSDRENYRCLLGVFESHDYFLALSFFSSSSSKEAKYVGYFRVICNQLTLKKIIIPRGAI
jgi:hypothetical protein